MKNDLLTLNWHFTNACNMNCRYCFIPKSKNLSEGQYLYILEKICNSGIFSRINFVGGEPTISPFLYSLLAATKKYGLQTSIVTNGYKLIKDADYCSQILSVTDSVGLSVDSLNYSTNYIYGTYFY